MEIVSAIVTPVVQSLMVPITKHLGYLISCTKYVRDMSTKIKDLDGKKVNVEEHMNHNKSNSLVVPAEVQGWLEKVAKTDEKVGSISSDVVSCFNLKRRHKIGRKAFKIIEEINRLIEENNTINWSDRRIPLGKVDSKKASASTPSSHHNDFQSRERTFMEALKQLQPDHKSQMIALCGMGGVGKTTMMEKLKKVAEEKKLFNMIVKVVIGEKMNTIAMQDAVADYLGIDLTEKSESARSDRLRKRFEALSNGGKEKILVILDDVWQFVHLNDMGLSPLPNQGVGFKLLLTSRDQSVCTRMGVEANSIFKVDVIEELEAHGFFHRFVELPNDDHELHKIGEDIVRKCFGLPIAIRTIACTLKDKSKDAWKDALSRLEHHDIDQVVHEVFEMSYKNLQDEETKSIFLLCGLFPEDFDIPKEDLVRYAWGLELLNKVYSMRHARSRLNTCIERLILANLLIQSQDVGCVKMHDLVREFVLDMYSKGEHTSVVGTMSNGTAKLTSESCKRISLTCTGMFEFPRNFRFPNLSLLKLMHGDESLKFPEDFYEGMKQLKVIAYDEMKYPLVSRSLQCSTNLRTLCLHRCLLMFDCSPIGDILNLEVLSFAYCSIQKLPTRIGNLKELKLLDLTGCVNLRIDNGVFINLVKLEELYMTVARKKGIRFTNANGEELVERSKNLFTLEIEFFDENVLPKDMLFKKLERFKISLGCYLEENNVQNRHPFENTLMLVTDKRELLDSRMNELFDKTEVLHFQVSGVNDLGDGLVESLHRHQSSFYNLRVLTICKCANLRYVFTVDVANGLKKIERLTVTFCPVLETLVDDDNNGAGVIKFQALKFLYFGHLPKLMSFCNVVNSIELPELEELILDSLPNFTSIYPHDKSTTMQPFLHKEVVIPRLKKLKICMMERLKEIWPNNPISLLHHLEELIVNSCGSIEVLFNIDLESVGNIEESSCCLRSIRVSDLENLREVWRIKGANNEGLTFSCFQAIENLEISDCKRFRNVFTPTTTNFDMRALTKLAIDHGERRRKRRQEINAMSNEEISEVGGDVSNVVFSSHLIHTTFHYVHALHIEDHNREETVFEIESPSSRELATTSQNNQQPLLPYLKDLELRYMECMSHVWKYNWNKFFIPQKQLLDESSSSFHNLTTISLWECKNIKYLFSPRMAKLLSNLKKIRILYCGVIEEVVSNRDDEDEEWVASTSTNTSIGLLSNFDYLDLRHLPNLKRIGDGVAKNSSNETSFNIITPIHDQAKFSQVDVAWSLCQYVRDIYMYDCPTLLYVIPSYALVKMQKLEKLAIMCCKSLVEVFETPGFNIDGGSGGREHNTMVIPRWKNINVSQLSNLKELAIYDCNVLQHVFTFSTLESLMQLQVLRIGNCQSMKVIVKDENGEQIVASEVVVFPRLKSIALSKLPNLTGFFLGKNQFRWPLLDDVCIHGCPQMMVFTSNRSIAPKLHYMRTNLGKHNLECGINFPVMATLHETPFSRLDTASSFHTSTISHGIYWSFHNLIEMDVNHGYGVEKLIPSNELPQLQQLERIYARRCDLVEEVFEALEGTNSNELQYVVKIPELREVGLDMLPNLKYIWKNNPWVILELPNLTKLSIDRCQSLDHVCSSSMFGSLLQLQELRISNCGNMEVIVKGANVIVEEECDSNVNEILMLPNLKSLHLQYLPSLKGFCLGKEAFSWPSLDTMAIKNCPTIRVFTKGDFATPKLKVIDTSFGRCELEKKEDLNSFINTKQQEGLEF